MGFLHKLWDETLAGPTPDSGLGKLRKIKSFSGSRSSYSAAAADPRAPAVDDGLIPISRSITILRRRSNPPSDSGSVPSSPAASTSPTSPLSPSGPGNGGHFKKLTRKKPNPAALLQQHAGAPTSPTASYDHDYWIVLCALDRT